jgi:hypothetical protein
MLQVCIRWLAQCFDIMPDGWRNAWDKRPMLVRCFDVVPDGRVMRQYHA